MVKISNIPMIIMKSIFTLSVIQLFFVSLLVFPSPDLILTQNDTALTSMVPEMLCYAAMSAILAPVAYTVADKYIEKYKK